MLLLACMGQLICYMMLLMQAAFQSCSKPASPGLVAAITTQTHVCETWLLNLVLHKLRHVLHTVIETCTTALNDLHHSNLAFPEFSWLLSVDSRDES